MIVNGFDSDNYRYFRHKETGKLYKFKNSSLNRLLFKSYLQDLNKEYPKEKPFDLIEFIKMQDEIVHECDSFNDFKFEANEYCLLTKWLEDRILSKDISVNFIFFDSNSIRMDNLDKLNQIDEDEIIDISNIENSNNLIPLSLIKSNNYSLTNLRKMYKFNRGISFTLPFKAGEKWNLTENIGLLFLMINQDFVKLTYECDEILGKEKEEIFYEQYKDNIPNTTTRYYKLKDDIKVKTSFELYNMFDDNNFAICKYNKNNYDKDGNIRYFYVNFYDGNSDIYCENNFLKYAIRLNQDDAIEKDNEDRNAEIQYERELKALEYVKKHISKYKKGTNRNMTPLEFMESEQRKERQYLGKRLIKTLYKRMEDLNEK